MRLKSIRIRNYKGFRDSELIELGRNWTVVVGRNNAGKSALLEVFSVRTFGDKPHRSISRSSEVPLDPHSQFDLVLEVSGKELERVFLSSGMSQLWVDVPDVATSEDFLRSHFLDGTLELSICWRGDRGWHSKRSPSHGLFAQSGNGLTRLIEPQSDRQRWQVSEWMDKHCQEAKYFGRAIKSDQNAPGGWRQSIDAPRLLSDLVGELTAHKQDYRGRKVHYGVALTRWLIENDADHLNALTEYVKSLLVGCQTES